MQKAVLYLFSPCDLRLYRNATITELLVLNLDYANKTNFTHMTTIVEKYIVCDTENAYSQQDKINKRICLCS
jgi:hypothetical protein